MTDKLDDKHTPSLFQVNFATWGAPIMVVATDFADATRIAIAHRDDDEATARMLICDVREQWCSTSLTMKAHTEAVLEAGRTGVAHYDDEDGWLVEECGG